MSDWLEWLIALGITLAVGALICGGALVWMEVTLRWGRSRPLPPMINTLERERGGAR